MNCHKTPAPFHVALQRRLLVGVQHVPLQSLLKHPKPNGSVMYFLCLKGQNVDAFIRDLWAMSSQVVWTEKN